MIIDSGSKDPQRMIEIGADEEWTPFLQGINQLMLEEKKARQENDSFKGAEICCKIVSDQCLYQAKIGHSFARLPVFSSSLWFGLNLVNRRSGL